MATRRARGRASAAQWNQAIYGVIILVALILSRLTSGEEQTS